MSIVTLIGVYSVQKLGRTDADQMMHLMCTTGALNLDAYFDDVEHSVKTVATLVQESLEKMSYEELDEQIERARSLFDKVTYNTNGVLTYYFRIDPEVSKTAKGFWYVNLDGNGFVEHEVTDISQYDTNDTSKLVWFTVPKATGKGLWLPPYFTEGIDIRVISYNVPVYREERFIGVIGIEIDYETMANEVENIKLFDDGYAFILDADSNVIYHPDLDSTLVYGDKIAVDEPDKVLGENHIQYNFNGVEKEAVWRPLGNGMRLYVSVPVVEINRSWHNLVSNILAVSLIILSLAGLIVSRFADRLTKPLSDLTEAAKKVEKGDYEFSLNYKKNDEIGILTNTFKQLASHTKDNISNLNKKVYVDALTSVRNKAGYSDAIAKLQAQIDDPKGKLEFAFGVFDCDNLKYINDSFGHDKGDAYLKAASSLICRIFKHSPVYRIGGDEFAVILQNEDYNNREELMKQFREAEAEISSKQANKWDQVNVAMGLAVYDPKTDPSVIDVARRADQKMYENKRFRKEQNSEI